MSTENFIEILAKELHDAEARRKGASLYRLWDERPEAKDPLDPWHGWQTQWREQARGLLLSPALRSILAAQEAALTRVRDLATKHYGRGYGDFPRDVLRAIDEQ